jgi:hypothetical protein
MHKIKAPRQFVVARKGVKGFFKTNIIDSLTTIVDISIKKVSEFKDLIASLVRNEPVRFINKVPWAKDRKIPKLNKIFKFLNILKVGEDLMTFILVSNKNIRYSCSLHREGLIEMREIHQFSTDTSVGKVAAASNSVIPNDVVKRTTAKIIRLADRVDTAISLHSPHEIFKLKVV